MPDTSIHEFDRRFGTQQSVDPYAGSLIEDMFKLREDVAAQASRINKRLRWEPRSRGMRRDPQPVTGAWQGDLFILSQKLLSDGTGLISVRLTREDVADLRHYFDVIFAPLEGDDVDHA